MTEMSLTQIMQMAVEMEEPSAEQKEAHMQAVYQKIKGCLENLYGVSPDECRVGMRANDKTRDITLTMNEGVRHICGMEWFDLSFENKGSVYINASYVNEDRRTTGPEGVMMDFSRLTAEQAVIAVLQEMRALSSSFSNKLVSQVRQSQGPELAHAAA